MARETIAQIKEEIAKNNRSKKFALGIAAFGTLEYMAIAGFGQIPLVLATGIPIVFGLYDIVIRKNFESNYRADIKRIEREQRDAQLQKEQEYLDDRLRLKISGLDTDSFQSLWKNFQGIEQLGNETGHGILQVRGFVEERAVEMGLAPRQAPQK